MIKYQGITIQRIWIDVCLNTDCNNEIPQTEWLKQIILVAEILKIQVPGWLSSGKPTFLFAELPACCTLTQKTARTRSLISPHKSIHPVLQVLSSWSHLQEAPCPNIITPKTGTLIYELGGEYKLNSWWYLKAIPFPSVWWIYHTALIKKPQCYFYYNSSLVLFHSLISAHSWK